MMWNNKLWNKEWQQMARSAFSSLSTQLLLWSALPAAVVLLTVSLVEIRGHEQAMQRLVQERANSLVQATATLVTVRVEQFQDTLVELADALSTDAPRLTVSQSDRIRAQDPIARGCDLALYATDGQLISATTTAPWLRQPAIGVLIQAVLTAQADRVVTLYDEEAQSWLLVQAALGPGQPPTAVLVGAIPIDTLMLPGLVRSLAPGPSAELHLEGATGQILAELARPHAAEESTATDKVVLAQTTVPATGWQVVLHESWANLVPPVLRYENAIFAGLALAVALSLLAAYFGLRRIVQPLRQLDWAASRVGWGDFQTIQQPVGGVTEIEDLRLALAGMADKIHQYQQELQSYIGAMTLGQEDERKRLARELHDETVQSLIALNQQVELIERDLSRDPRQAAGRLSELRPLLAEAIAGLRRQIQDLRPLYLEDLGFVPALEMLIRQTTQQHHLIGDFEVSGQPYRRLAPTLEISAYRIVQEALRNVISHAHATWVHIELIFDNADIMLRIEDDGVGFHVSAHPYRLVQEGHYGLLGMQERAQLCSGHFDIESEIGKGTIITVQLPITELGETVLPAENVT